MGTSFVGLGEPLRGFWIKDGVLEVWLRFLALHVEDPVESGSLATRIRDQWLFASRGYFTGCVHDGLAEAVSTPEGEKLVRDSIHSLLHSLKSSPAQLNSDVINLMGINGKFVGGFDTWRLIEVGEAYLELLDGKCLGDAGDFTYAPGSGMSRQGS